MKTHLSKIKQSLIVLAVICYPIFCFSQGNSNNEKITICHIPPGNPENAHTITINKNALQSHLDHGDYIGPCKSEMPDLLEFNVHPNPYIDNAVITYEIHSECFVLIELYEHSGIKISTLKSEKLDAGRYQESVSVELNSSNSNILLIRASALSEDEIDSDSVLLMKAEF
jgi:hypothetical protein